MIGAGVSSLSLAVELAQKGTLPGDVVLYDPHPEGRGSQTFSFWREKNSVPSLEPEYRWGQWSFSTLERAYLHVGTEFEYAMISSEYFRSHAHRIIQAHPQIHIEAQRLMTSPDAVHVFDSRPPALEEFRVKQSFVGLEVELTQAHSIDTVQLMHEMTYLDQGLDFRYVLPLSKTRLLVEYTRFTVKTPELSDLESACHRWLETRGGAYQVMRREAAHIPMGLNQIGPHWGMPIGARAGMTRDATGYGFIEIQRWAAVAADQLMSSHRIAAYRVPYFRRWMDECLLRIIEVRPEVLPQLFMSLAERLSPDQFARFMMSCQFSNGFKVMWNGPKWPFFLSALGRPQWI